MSQIENSPLSVDEEKLERTIAHDYFCRFHMMVILAAVISSGVLASKGLLELGVSLGYRYPIAVLVSYAVFLLLIRVWIWYVSVRSASRLRGGSGGGFNFTGGSFNIGGGRSGSGGGFSGYGGGSSGGGGATSDWEGNEAAGLIAQSAPQPSGGGGHWWSGFDLGGGDSDGWVVVLLLIALVTCILGGGVYLVVVAPHVLPEAACQVVLAGGLTRVSKEHHHNWMTGVVWSTWIPFLLVLLLAGALGWEAHKYCPPAHRLIDLLSCPAK